MVHGIVDPTGRSGCHARTRPRILPAVKALMLQSWVRVAPATFDGGLDVGGGHGDTAVQLVYCGDEVQILPHRTKSHLKKASHSEH
ncbi:MAG: hypothetical protein QOJ20_5258 [Mycobacterium sp.]|nr:hypothetical protein [Mycobacterium sp.]MDT5284063.1 hypothetical protein [Mycobacterium sp.]